MQPPGTTLPPVVAGSVDILDAGWRKIKFNSRINDVVFLNENTGYVLANSLFKSDDGGLSWRVVLNTQLLNGFVTADGKAFFVGGDRIYYTTDGGAHFTNPASPGLSGLNDIFFASLNEGFAIGPNKFFKSTDAGVNWQMVPAINFGTSDYYTLSFTSSDNGWVANKTGIFRFDAGNLNWVKSNIFVGAATGYTSIFAISPKIVYAANTSSEIVKSTDGGINFSFVGKLESASNLFIDIHFLTEQLGYACLNNSVYKTIDGGITWKSVVYLVKNRMVELHFTDANHGWAGSSDSTRVIYKQ